MSLNRREFLRLAGVAGAGMALGAPRAAAQTRRTAAPLDILILGGTGFIGPYQVRYAVERGHRVSIFTRGRSEADLPEGIEYLTGDRVGNLDALRGRRWDAVIDNSATNPQWVRDSAQLLRDAAGQYVFISTRSVYSDTSRVPLTVDAPVFTRENTPVEPGRPLPYGLSKALAEAEARAAFGERATVVRPGLIIGPGDDTDRFTYWPVRIERGGEVLAPGDPSDPVQIIDARDLSEWVIRLVEGRTFGTFNAVGPANPRPMAELLYGIRAVTTAETTFTWVDADFLAEQGIRPYAEMPVWMPPRDGREGFARVDLSREVAAGLTFRPLAVTARDTLEYHHSRPAERRANLRAGITPEREREVLAAWHARRG